MCQCDASFFRVLENVLTRAKKGHEMGVKSCPKTAKNGILLKSDTISVENVSD